MNAALLPRPARVILAAALLCGLAGCDREPERQQAAAASASPATPPGAKLDYMTEHVARDAALSDALIGTWNEVTTDDDGTQLDAVVRYAADRTLTVVVAARNKPDNRYSSKGTWSVAQGFLTYRLTAEGSDKTIDGSDQILRIDKSEFVYVDGGDKKTKIATRTSDAALTAAAAAPQPAAPARAVAAAPPEDTPFTDETRFVAQKEIEFVVFRLSDAAQVRVTAEIEERVPLNVIVLPGRITEDRFTQAVGNLAYSGIVSIYEDSKINGVNSLDDFFASRLSKRAAYGRFDSPWVTLSAGAYTVILDKWGELSPTRGDAPVHLRLYSRPVP